MAEEKRTDCLCFFVNGKKVVEEHVDPETMLVSFLREKCILHPHPSTSSLLLLLEMVSLAASVRLTGTKSSCGGGGCGACTVMVSRHFSANACLLPVCQLAGAAITTVEGIGSSKTRLHPVQVTSPHTSLQCSSIKTRLHPVQVTSPHTSLQCSSIKTRLHLVQVTSPHTSLQCSSIKTRLHLVQERLAKAHGSQCGFCSPGMVMSMYTLLRNHPQPSMEEIREALGGNLCRCTGYRPIIDSCRTFSQESKCCQGNGGVGCCLNEEESTEPEPSAPQLFNKEDFLPLDPTQELIFPPELMTSCTVNLHGKVNVVPYLPPGQRMVLTEPQQTQRFQGERMSWVSPVSLAELVLLKTHHPWAPLVLGNTTIGPEMKFKGVVHPMIISPSRVPPLFEVIQTPQGNNPFSPPVEFIVIVDVSAGVWVGAGLSLTQVRSVLEARVEALSQEKTELYRALLDQLRTLAGQQIRNVASLGGNIVSAHPNSNLNPVLAAGGCRLSVVSDGGRREVLLNQDFFTGFGKTVLKAGDIVVSVFIPETQAV
ncbi:Aldehyde oxidase 2 [Merluccius polli]|uniref:Aldehyde oxidase 2 n=1 Tax=Merluccius polli TaxID=89951 RepID=A0AA47NPH1_MERPO|nr:Aldehyde oxidase 2 [Merluccius polli]